MEYHRLPGGAVQGKVKPLRKLGMGVPANRKLNIKRILQTLHLDGAGIKLGGNMKFGHSDIVKVALPHRRNHAPSIIPR